MRWLVAALAATALGALPVPAGADVPAGHTGWAWASPQPQGSSLNALAFAGDNGVAVGDRGAVIHTDDGGRTWSGGDADTAHDLTDVAMPAANTVFVGGGCALRRSDDGGTLFRRLAIAPRETPCHNRIQALAFPTPDIGYVFLRTGVVLRTTNGGRTFVRRAPVPVTNGSYRGEKHVVTAVGFGDANTGLVTQNGFDPPLFRTADGGASWQTTVPMRSAAGVLGSIPAFSAVHGVEFISPSVALVAGELFGEQGMASTDNAGLTWTWRPMTGAHAPPQSLDCADALRCVMLTANSNGAFGGGLIVTADGGQTATHVSAPAFPARTAAMTNPAGIVVLGADGAGYRSADLGQTFAPIGTSVEGSFTGLRRGGGYTLYAFGPHADLARSTDGGVDWQQLPALPAPSVLDMSFENGPTGYVLTAGGGLARSDDSGESWSSWTRRSQAPAVFTRCRTGTCSRAPRRDPALARQRRVVQADARAARPRGDLRQRRADGVRLWPQGTPGVEGRRLLVARIAPAEPLPARIGRLRRRPARLGGGRLPAHLPHDRRRPQLASDGHPGR